jgi:hypothetical protein
MAEQSGSSRTVTVFSLGFVVGVLVTLGAGELFSRVQGRAGLSPAQQEERQAQEAERMREAQRRYKMMRAATEESARKAREAQKQKEAAKEKKEEE